MNKFILAFVVSTFLMGCATKPVIKTEYVNVEVPVVVVPAPPIVDKPILAIDSLSDSQLLLRGEVAKAYVISISQLESYSNELELIIAKYTELSSHNPKL